VSRIIDDGAGGKRNLAEIESRAAALRSAVEKSVYNPPMDPAQLSKAALEATQGAMPLPAMRVYAKGGKVEADLKLRGGDNVIEEETDAGHGEEVLQARRQARGRGEEEEEAQPQEQGTRGHGGVQARDASVRFGSQGSFAQAGSRDSPSSVWVERVYEGKTKEEVSEMIPVDARAVTYSRVWKATALVRQ